MEKKTVTFVALMNEFLLSVVDQCHELGVSKDFHIEVRTVQQLPYHPIPAGSLIVLSGGFIYLSVKQHLPAGSTVITAKRMIQYTNIRKMLEIPKGMKVLLVSDLKETAEETVSLLQESGMDLDFYSYYPGKTYPEDIEIAVTPGEADLVPSSIRKVVDIGSRIIDLSTWLGIYAHFQYESDNIQKITARSMQSLIYITNELNNEIRHANLLSKYLEAIVNKIEDAVIAVDQDAIIRFINEKAIDTLHLHGIELIERKADECLPEDFHQIMLQSTDDEEELVDWANKTYFFRKMRIDIEGKFHGYLMLFRKAAEIEKLEHDYRMRVYSKGLVAKYSFDDIYGKSFTFQKVIQIAQKIARSNSTVLLLGETGTGKELFAQAIHNASPRRREPFVGVNFAAISESLLESELFGYEEGAFTGARKGGHIGWFEQAHKGTIFLDEIGDANGAIQNRLLRVLQERQIMRVGGSKIIPIDIRVIAATNQDLQTMVQEGTFRADLYYRLNILPIHLPPLRKRVEDIPWLSNQFIRKNCMELKRPPFVISNEALKAMEKYHWPGNIRELENVIEYLAHVVEDELYSSHLPFLLSTMEAPPPFDEAIQHHFQELLHLYQQKGFLSEIFVILQIFAEDTSHGGRYAILEQIQAKRVSITEQQLRYRFKMLQQDELIQVGRGRQGSKITEKGRQFVAYLQKIGYIGG